MIFGAIVAGGTGSRLKNDKSITDNSLPDLPKQFLTLKDKPIVCYSVDTFLKTDEIDKLFIGVHPDFVDYMAQIVDKYFSDRRDDIIITVGGDDRNGTLMNIIDKAYSLFGKAERHFIITHDAVRPFVTKGMIRQNIFLVKKYGAVDTVCKCTDTVISSNGGEYIDSIPDRATMYNGQTPQSFDMALFEQYYNNLSDDLRKTLTDGCKIFSANGHKVYLAKGESFNMKITTKSDYYSAQALADLLLG